MKSKISASVLSKIREIIHLGITAYQSGIKVFEDDAK
jgi:hypothetical protein